MEPTVAAAPRRLAEHVAGLLELAVLTGPPDPDTADPVLIVVDAASVRSVVDDGLVEALGARVSGVICWHLAPADLVRVLDHLQAAGVPAFVGVPNREQLLEALAARNRAARHQEDVRLALALARIDEQLGAILDA